jgi:hypothetical protein
MWQQYHAWRPPVVSTQPRLTCLTMNFVLPTPRTHKNVIPTSPLTTQDHARTVASLALAVV